MRKIKSFETKWRAVILVVLLSCFMLGGCGGGYVLKESEIIYEIKKGEPSPIDGLVVPRAYLPDFYKFLDGPIE